MSKTSEKTASNHPGILWCLATMIRHARHYKWTVIAVLGAVIIEACFIGSLSLSFKHVADEVSAGKGLHVLIPIAWILGAGVIVAAFASIMRTALYSRVVAGIISEFRDKMFSKLQALSMDYFGRTRPGETITRFSGDLATVENAFTSVMPMAITPGIGVCVSVALLIWLDWRLALGAVLICPLALIGPRLIMPRALRAASGKLDMESQTLQWVQENLAGQPVVKAFCLESQMKASFQERNSALRTMMGRLNLASGMVENTAIMAIWVLQVFVLIAGAYMTYRGWITIGTLCAFQALFMNLSDSLYYVSQYSPTLIQASGALKHIDDLLQEEAKVTDAAQATELPLFKDKIVVEDVSFSYTGDRPNLDNVTATINRGSTVAFVGGSGSGKSTVTNLVMRLYDPNSGRITVDGHNLKEVAQHSWRSQIGTVLQDNFLFNTSIRENIRYGNPLATDEQIIQAAKAAEIHDVIMRLPQEYDTQVGERGGRLSGGQRQRVAIARALVANPSVLVLDEATSALDPATEAQVNQTLSEAGRGRTVLSVTHRLASVKNFDQIFVFDKGRLVERGCHNELLAREGYYYDLWQKQNACSLSEDGEKVKVDVTLIRKLPILETLPTKLQERVASLFVTEHYSENCPVISEGDPGDRFYLIVRGKVEVLKTMPSGEQKRITVLNDGDYFGEMALLHDLPRNATVRTLTGCVFASIRREHFLELLKQAPQFRKQVSITAGVRNKRQDELNQSSCKVSVGHDTVLSSRTMHGAPSFASASELDSLISNALMRENGHKQEELPNAVMAV